MRRHALNPIQGVRAVVYNFIDTYNKTGDKELFETIIKELPKFSDVKYLGFRKKIDMERHLAWAMYGPVYGKRTPLFDSSVERQSFEIIKSGIKKCSRLLKPPGTLRILLFPTFDPFVKEKMHGSTGFCMWKNTMTLYIHPQAVKSWKEGLSHSICHEYAHSVTHKYHKWETLLDGFVFEGLAEHFREAVLKEKPSKWSTALSKPMAKKIFMRLKSKLDSKNGNLYKQVFYSEGKKFPMWTGYSIGYYIVGDYLRNSHNDWNTTFKMEPKDILAISSFAK